MPLQSWVPYTAECLFPLENLPYGAVKRGDAVHCATALGEYVIDLHVLAAAGLLPEPAKSAFQDQPNLNPFLALGKPAWSATRKHLQELFSKDNATLRDNLEVREAAFVKQEEAELVLPMKVGDYTDFYSSKEHATNLGKLFRPGGDPLLPNWTWIPVGYHGRASSIVVSGTDVRRPLGQTRPDETAPPGLSACKQMDFELEMGFVVGGNGNKLGEPIPIEQAEDSIFGMVLFNDWSARDIQKWEYVPLGPFLGKSFASTASPWVVSLEALEPFRTEAPAQDPAPLEYLKEPTAKAQYDIDLTVTLQTEKMEAPQVISRSNHKYLYWSIRQQLTHHTINGCNVSAGDMLASGTISGPEEGSYGSMLEISWRGSKPIEMSSGEKRGLLQDGDTLGLEGVCQGDGFRIGFGPCNGKITPAIAL